TVALLTVDLIQQNLDLLQVVALNILKAICPGAGVSGVARFSRNVATRKAHNARYRHNDRIDLRAVEIQQRGYAAANRGFAAHNVVGRMLVRPSRVKAMTGSHTEDRVYTNVITRIHARASGVRRIPWKIGRIDSTTTGQVVQIEVEAFVIHHGCSGRA